MAVLVLTEEGDVHADYVIKAIERLGGECIRFHTETLVDNTEYFFSFSGSRAYSNFLIKDSGLDFCVGEIRSVYYRRPKKPVAPQNVEDPGIKEFIENESEALLAGLYLSLTDVNTWVNHPTKNRLAGNKIGQLRKAAEIGLKIPDTLITNSVDKAYHFFYDSNKDVICKSIRQELAFDDGKSVFVFTHKIPKEAKKVSFEGVRSGSSILQRRIRKRSDVRVTLVGHSCFAVEIENDEVDWRKIDPYSLPHKVIDLPDQLKQQLIALQSGYGLLSSQMDLLLTHDNEFVFLEINPNGQWLWVELITGLPIAEAIAKFLLDKQPIESR